MKAHITPDKELVATIRSALKENDGYCPCIYQSKGKSEYKCMCQEFREQIKDPNYEGYCHCMLYYKKL